MPVLPPDDPAVRFASLSDGLLVQAANDLSSYRLPANFGTYLEFAADADPGQDNYTSHHDAITLPWSFDVDLSIERDGSGYFFSYYGNGSSRFYFSMSTLGTLYVNGVVSNSIPLAQSAVWPVSATEYERLMVSLLMEANPDTTGPSDAARTTIRLRRWADGATDEIVVGAHAVPDLSQAEEMNMLCTQTSGGARGFNPEGVYGIRIYQDALSVEDAWESIQQDGGDPPDEVSPRIVDVSPPLGTPPDDATTPLEFTLVDASLRAAFILDRTGRAVYDSREFVSPYRGSTVTETTYEDEYALRFSIARTGGWRGPRFLRVLAVDAAGNHEVLV